MRKLTKWLRADSGVRKGASEVEAAYQAHVREQAEQAAEDWGGEVEDYMPSGTYTLSRIGEVDAGALWAVSDSWGYYYVYVLDTGGSAEVFVAKSKEGTELRLRDDVAEAFAESMDELAGDTAAVLTAWLERRVAKAYKVVKAEDEQRYTLGVAYPANEVDSHGDFTDEVELERAAWAYMAKGRSAGVDHADGTDWAGVPVESYIWRGPDWTDDDGNLIAKSGDWLLGVVWGEDAWDRIKKDELTGYSIQGTALIEDEEPDDA